MKVLQVLHLPSAAPAKQNEVAPKVTNCVRTSADLYEGAASAAPTSKCCTCHTKRAGGAPSAAPATQNEAAPKVINCRRTSADLYEGAPSVAPATQKRA